MKKLVILIIILLVVYAILPETQVLNIQLGELTIPKPVDASRGNNLRSDNIKNYNLTVDMDLRTKSYLDENDYNAMLGGTNLEGIGAALVEAENIYNINGLYLMGLCCLESSYGTSNFAVNRNNLVRLER